MNDRQGRRDAGQRVAGKVRARMETVAVGCEPPAPLLGAMVGAAHVSASGLLWSSGLVVESSSRGSAEMARGRRSETNNGIKMPA